MKTGDQLKEGADFASNRVTSKVNQGQGGGPERLPYKPGD